MNIQNAHLLETDQLVKEFQTHLEYGLSENEVQKKRLQFGANELIEKGGRSALTIMLSQFTEMMVIILLVAALISLFLREYIDASVILVIVIMNAILGFWQEYHAENAIAALKKLAVPNVRVRRGGTEKEISAKELVPGDIILLETGNIVPADARLVNAVHLKTQESALTGESESVEKCSDKLIGDHITLPDRKNMVYMGTIVVCGRALAVVIGTGMQTEIGKIATMLQTVEEESTPLQKRLT
ncbi:HAD-IC family P-type ATPase, partial [bacterium]|nr:HAD-IC family P-type ATPase [bacterium]